MIIHRNIGSIDRAARLVAGIVLLSLVFVGPQTVWGWLGVIPLVTSMVGFCPVYALFRRNTCQIGDVNTCG